MKTMYQVLAKWQRGGDWAWMWDCESYGSALALRKQLRRAGYAGVAIDAG